MLLTIEGGGSWSAWVIAGAMVKLHTERKELGDEGEQKKPKIPIDLVWLGGVLKKI